MRQCGEKKNKYDFQALSRFDKFPFNDGICLLVPPDNHSHVALNNSRDQDFQELSEDLGGSIQSDWGVDAIGKISWGTTPDEDSLDKNIFYLLEAVNGLWIEQTMELLKKEARIVLRGVRPFPMVLQNHITRNIGREDAPCITVDVGWKSSKVIIFFEIEGTLIPVNIRVLDGGGLYAPMLGVEALLKQGGRGQKQCFHKFHPGFF